MAGRASELLAFGWHAHFTAQLAPGELETTVLVRVIAVHRDALQVLGPAFEGRVVPRRSAPPATVGDWLVLEAGHRVSRLLERRSGFKRKSPGDAREVQLIAANVDTVFVVTSANEDFNPARLERYLAITREAEVTPVVVITKADLTADPRPYLDLARGLTPGLVVEALDARSPSGCAVLEPWLQPGQTVALLGSSGVGKSTLVNTLLGADLQATQTIREADARGRHTTTVRSLHRLAGGAWLLDSPGMRELQLVDAAEGIGEVFDDITALAAACRFTDCRHESEPGCAVREALAAGRLDSDRLARYQKLVREERHNSQSIAESRASSRAFGKLAKQILGAKARRRGDQ